MMFATVAFGAANYATLCAYLVGTLALGVWFTRRNRTTHDYFKAGGRIPWWVVGISLSNVSSISYMSLPAKGFAEDWSVSIVNLPIVLLAPLVVFVFLPLFRSLQSASAYEFLERRFSLGVRLYGSAAFVLFQVSRMALVVYMPALALSAVTDFNIYACILLIGALSAIYSALGGMSGVVWTDFAQTLFLLGALVLALALIVSRLDGGFGQIISSGIAEHRISFAAFTAGGAANFIWLVLVGSCFAQVVPYVSDQSMIQRYMTTTDLRACSRAIWTNAMLAVVNTPLFLLVGTSIFVYYQTNPAGLSDLPHNDSILPYFIARELPAGVAGLVVAGIFAAAQSAISTSLSSTSTALVTDFLQRLGPARSDEHWLRTARWLTASLGVVAIGFAGVLAAIGIGSAFDVFQRIIGLTTSGLAGVFLLGIGFRHANVRGAWAGIAASGAVLYFVQVHTDVHVYLYAMVGIGTCIVVGACVSVIFRPPAPAETPAVAVGRERP